MGFIKRVEGVKELFLGSVFTGEELHVVHKENINASVFLSKSYHSVVLDGADKLVDKILRRDIGDFHAGVFVENIVGNSMHQMSFAQTHTAVNKKGIIRFCRKVCNGKRGRMGKLVKRADDKVFKGII